MFGSGSLPLGRIAGVPVVAHWSVLLVALLFGPSLAATHGVIGAALGLVAFAASILAHELAHAIVARRHGVATQSIQLWALGGIARLDREATTPRAAGWIAAAGPLTSLLLGAFALAGAAGTSAVGAGSVGTGTASGVLLWLGLVNVALAVFNMLPGSPLDGGRVLQAVRWGHHGDRFRAVREAANAGKAVGFSMVGVGAVMIVNGHPGMMLLVTGIFLAVSAKAESLGADLAERLHGTRVGDLTWYGVAHATPDTDADTMLWQRSRLGGAGVVVIEQADGRLSGIVSEEQLLAVPIARRHLVHLSSLMVPFSDLARADPDDDLADVLSRLNPGTPVVTVWREGRLLGVVPRRRLLARLTA